MRLALFRLYQVLTAFLAFVDMTSAGLVEAEEDGGERGENSLDKKQPYMPTFLPTPSNVTFLTGEVAVLQCAIENRGTRTVAWRRASDPNPLTIGEDTFVGDPRFYVKHRKHSLEWNLHIRQATPEDSGVYECQVITKSRDIRQMILLHVDDTQYVPTYKPDCSVTVTDSKHYGYSRSRLAFAAPCSSNSSLKGEHLQDIQISGSHFVEKGNTLTLTCGATGFDYPPDELDWFKDGLKLSNGGRLHLTKDVSLSEKTIVSKLQVSRAIMSDAGTYVCRTSDMQVTSAKVNVLNTETINEKRADNTLMYLSADSSNQSTVGFHGRSSAACHVPVSVLSLLTSLFVYLVSS